MKFVRRRSREERALSHVAHQTLLSVGTIVRPAHQTFTPESGIHSPETRIETLLRLHGQVAQLVESSGCLLGPEVRFLPCPPYARLAQGVRAPVAVNWRSGVQVLHRAPKVSCLARCSVGRAADSKPAGRGFETLIALQSLRG